MLTISKYIHEIHFIYMLCAHFLFFKGLYCLYLFDLICDLFSGHDCRTWDAWRFHRTRRLQNLVLKIWRCNVQSCKPLRHSSSLSCIFANVLSLNESDSFPKHKTRYSWPCTAVYIERWGWGHSSLEVMKTDALLHVTSTPNELSL